MLRSFVALKPRDVPVRVALRNAAAVVMPLAIGIPLGQTGAGLAIATGALNTMFTDQPGPYRLRMQRMLMAAVAAGRRMSAVTIMTIMLVRPTRAAIGPSATSMPPANATASTEATNTTEWPPIRMPSSADTPAAPAAISMRCMRSR